ncbi:MAG: glycine zipper 2TM domain-containing protein [Desulfohalobiaceae bacterium]|nr:glycine zipper 2TM domain-containing protein [Desulfohalobiaceae bacterium]
MKTWIVFLGFFLVLSLAGCGSKAQQGSVVGGLSGALVGSHLGPEDDSHRLENALIGAGIGALFGYAVGNELDKYDRGQIGQTLEYTPSHQTREWVNPDTRNRFRATPAPAYQSGGRICRDVDLDAWIDGRRDQVRARACRRPNGRWELVR